MFFYLNFFSLSALLFLLPGTLLAQPWQLQKDEQGIRIYLRDVPDSSIKEFKGEIRINAGLGSLLAVMDDTNACPEWIYNCKDPILLEKINFIERYNFQISKMPLFITNRGIIFQTFLSQDPVSKTVTMKMRASPEYCNNKKTRSCQYIKTLNFVPVLRSIGYYKFIPESDGWVRVIWQQHIEPGGNLPAWLVNSLLTDMPYNTLNNLRDIVRSHNYKGVRLLYGSDGLATGFRSR